MTALPEQPQPEQPGQPQPDETAVGFVRACAMTELTEDGVRRAVLGPDGPAVVVVRTGGRVHALTDLCSHQDFRLSEGEVFDGGLECPLHGSLFDLTTGAPDGPPATRPVPVHPVRIEGDDVLVHPVPASAGTPGAAADRP